MLLGSAPLCAQEFEGVFVDEAMSNFDEPSPISDLGMVPSPKVYNGVQAQSCFPKCLVHFPQLHAYQVRPFSCLPSPFVLIDVLR